MNSYKNRKSVLITMKGDAFTFDRYPLPPVRKAKRSGRAPHGPPSLNEERLGGGECVLNRKVTVKHLIRTKSRLIAALCSIQATELKFFISLMTPRKQRPFVDIGEERKVFDSFIRRLRYGFPNCRFIYKVEWDSAARIHFHLIGDFTRPKERPTLTPSYLKREVKRMWEAATRASADNSVNLKWCSERHRSYLTGRKKFKEDLACLGYLQGARMWGYVNKKAVAFHKRETFKLTPKQFYRFSRYINKFFYRRCPEACGHIYQLSRTRGRVGYVPREIIKAAITYAVSRG